MKYSCELARDIALQQKRYHDKRYVNYRKEAKDKSRLTKQQLEDKINEIISKGYVQIPHTTIRKKVKPMSYSLCHNSRLITLSTYDGKDYHWYMTDYRDDSKNKDTGSPFSEFRQLFKDRNGLTITEAFGKTEQYYKRCCPQPLYYQSPFWAKETWISNICKEDFSSHYPSNALGLLPDASTAITKPGRVKPNEEYRFAFYVKSGHVAEYGRFDSHDYMKEVSTFSAKVSAKKQFETDYGIKDEDETTVLMKASEYDLEQEIRHFYDIKNSAVKDSPEYKSAKLFLLKFIGMMEQCNPMMYEGYPYAHLAAVIKWRANVKTFNTLKKIGYDKILQVCVDGFIHAGKPVGCHEKQLGNLVVEFDKAKFIQKGINQYILKQGDVTEHKTAGFDINTDSDDITDWEASAKVKFLTYMKSKYNIEEIK